MKDLAPLLQPPDLIQRFLQNEEEVRQEYLIAWVKLRSIHALYKKIRGKTCEQARKIITQWLSLTTGEKIATEYLYDHFTKAIGAAKDFKQSLVREFVPDAIRFPFTSDGLVNPTIDPVEILRIIWNPPGDECHQPLRSFVAMVHWLLGIRYLLMRIQHKNYAKQLSSLTLWLEKNMFVGKTVDLPFRENVIIKYNPDDHNRFDCFADQASGENCLMLTLWYRFIDIDGRVIKILYDSRIKKEEDNFRKTLVKSKAESPVSHDTCAISMVFFSKADLNAAYLKMIDSGGIFGNGAVILNTKINGQGGKSHNQYSSMKSSPEMQFLIYVQGEILEVQLFTFTNYFNRKLSLGPENHHLYRLQQVFPLLKILFPATLFFRWEDKKVFSWLEAFQRAKIQTNYLGLLLPGCD